MSAIEAVFQAMEAAIKARGAEYVRKVRGVVRYEIVTKAGKDVWSVDLKNAPKVVHGAGPRPDLTVTMAEASFIELATGKLKPQAAFMKGKLKLKGNMSLAMKLNTVIDGARQANPDLEAQIAAIASGKPVPSSSSGGAASGGGGASAPAAASGETLAPGLASSPVFDEIRNHVQANGPKLVKQLKAIIEFKIGSTYVTLDLKNGSGAVYAGQAKQKADLQMTVGDDDFVALSMGTLNAQAAFMKGKLKLRGNMTLAMKLNKVLAAARPKAKL